MKDKLVVETISTNPDYRIFHCAKKLTEDFVNLHFFNRERVVQEQDNLSTAGFNALKMLLLIEGIDEVSVRQYSLSITKGKAFDWVNIDNAVESIFKGLSRGGLTVDFEYTKINESPGNWDDLGY